MNVQEEVILILKKAMEEKEYQNPYFIQAILTSLEDVYGYEDKELSKWSYDLWGY